MIGRYIRVVVTLVLVVQTIRDRFPAYSLSQRDKQNSRDLMYSAFLVARVFEIPFLLWLLYHEISDVRTSFTLLHLIGALLYLVGDILRSSAKAELGRLFTYDLGIRDEHRLITTGPYQYLVHPSYTGYALMTSGLLVYFQSLYLLVVNLVLGVFTFSRIFYEEEMLLQEFGEEFIEFLGSRERFVPLVF